MKKMWETKAFGEALEIRNGRNQREVESPDGEFPIYGSAGNVMGMATDYICEAGTTIIGRKGNINSPIYAETRFWNVDTAFGLTAKPGLDPRFLYFFCLLYDFGAHNRGTTIPSLVKSELLNIPMPVPPLAEQRRIVAILDEAFEAIAIAKANTEENLKNARELFTNGLERIFSEVATRGRRVALETIGATQTGSTPKSSEPENLGDYLPFVKPGDFNRDGSITFDNDGLSESGAKKARRVKANSALMVCIGATIGKCGFTDREIATNQQVNAWTPTTTVSAKFIYHQMTTADFQRRVRQSAGQATLPIINKSKWSALTVVVPPTLDEQLALAGSLDSLLAESMNLEAVYERKLIALDELKKSLLHQAFSGAL
jgi:type I restriction enzyme S subunit